ncbi:MAG: phosphoglucosamine mutase, partial [Pyrinomonadaceae bacterium]
MNKLFGTDGIRGEAGTFPLDAATVRTIGKSLAEQYEEELGRRPRFVTGRDTRESGRWTEEAFNGGATSGKAICESAGVITTPGVAFVTGKFGFDLGIVISASHNPYNDNGIKIFSQSGKKVDETIEAEVEKDVFSEKWDAGEKSVAVDLQREAEFRNAYMAHLDSEMHGLKLGG